MKQKSIAIMAAGIGSRFGSLKQTHPVINGYAILDFSIYDALQAGFNHIVFIVREEILDVFKEKYVKKLPKHILVEFVIQNTSGFTKRKKPWGTGQALLSLKHTINNPFALINADDFYGRKSFTIIHDALYQSSGKDNYFVGYRLKNTLSDFGTVSRGECFINNKQHLSKIVEHNHISKEHTILPLNTIVSMNFWGFSTEVFSIANNLFEAFLVENEASQTAEFFITHIVDCMITEQHCVFKMLESECHWFGVTYKEDEIIVKKQLQNLIYEGVYPTKLW